MLKYASVTVIIFILEEVPVLTTWYVMNKMIDLQAGFWKDSYLSELR